MRRKVRRTPCCRKLLLLIMLWRRLMLRVLLRRLILYRWFMRRIILNMSLVIRRKLILVLRLVWRNRMLRLVSATGLMKNRRVWRMKLLFFGVLRLFGLRLRILVYLLIRRWLRLGKRKLSGLSACKLLRLRVRGSWWPLLLRVRSRCRLLKLKVVGRWYLLNLRCVSGKLK